MIYSTACIGSRINIRKTPTAPPINDPTYGIIAVKPIITLITVAYGNPKRLRTMKNIVPRITASRH